MIIFNLWAIPVGIVALVAVYLLGHIWPASMGPPVGGWTTGVIFFFVGGVAELVGMKARLFFLPIWLIGLGIIGYQMGVVGSVIFVVLLLAAMIAIHRKTKKQEAATWADLQSAPPIPPPVGADETQFWTWAKDSLFLPVCTDYTPDVCAHDLRILKLIRESGIPLSPGEAETIRAQEDFLAKAQTEPKPPGVEPKVQRPMERLVATRLRAAQEKPSAPATAQARPPGDRPDAAASDKEDPTVDPPTVEVEIMWGGYYTSRTSEDGGFRVFRLLDFSQASYHAALFREKFERLPSLADIVSLAPFVGHVPLDPRSLMDSPIQLIGAVPLAPADLEGYMIYLEHHGFSLEEREQLIARLLGFSREVPLRLRLSVVNGQVQVEPIGSDASTRQ
jgi:hypothetical protein